MGTSGFAMLYRIPAVRAPLSQSRKDSSMSNPGQTPPDQPDPTAPTGDSADDGSQDSGSTTVVTICKEADGSYMVYAGDAPEDGEGDEGDAGGGGDMGAPQGTPADSVGAALKAAMDVLKQDENGGAQSEFDAGFTGGSAASPAKPPMAAGASAS